MPPEKTTGLRSNDVVIAALREHQARIKEILESIERRDLSPSQVRDHLGWIADGIKRIRMKVGGEAGGS